MTIHPSDLGDIDVEWIYPPIPCRKYDYRATLVSDRYEEQPPTGYGPTPEAAIADLRETLELWQ